MPERVIDRALDAHSHSGAARSLHGIYATALNGLARAAYDADRLALHSEATDLRARMIALDVHWAPSIAAAAARDT